MVFAPAGNFPQDHTSLMEITSKSNEFLRANVKAAEHFSENLWTTDNVSEVQMALVGRISNLSCSPPTHKLLRYICFLLLQYTFEKSS